MAFAPTPQQQAIIDWCATPIATLRARGESGHALGRARAGTGKTATLVQSFPNMLGRVACTAFNKKIATEVAGKVKAAGMVHVDVATAHSFGLRTLKKAFPKVRPDLGGWDWWKEMEERMMQDGFAIPRELRRFVRKGLDAARQRAFGILRPANDPGAWLRLAHDFDLEDLLFEDPSAVKPDERAKMLRNGLRLTHKALTRSVDIAERIVDGAGMIYVPLIKGIPYDQYPWCVMDEAQDTDDLRRTQFKRQLAPGGRALFVGDDKQAINAFAGANSDSLEIIAREFSTREFPLTVTFRCPQRVVARARTLVPDYEAHPSAPEGEIDRMAQEAFEKIEHLRSLVPGRDAILCRNTRPLVDLAFAMIKRQIPCYIEGRNLSASLIALATRWTKVKLVGTLKAKLNAHREKETQRLLGLDREDAADRLNDEVEALFAFMEGEPDRAHVDAIVEKIKALFSDTKAGEKPRGVVLSTVHKAKGLEWDTVYLWGANRYMPSRMARTEEALAQETHLLYVGWTRAQRRLVDVDVPFD